MIFKRRKYIVDKRFQGKFILFFVIISSFISIVATVVFNHIALKRLESIMWSAHISVKTTDEVIGSLFIYVNIKESFSKFFYHIIQRRNDIIKFIFLPK